MSTQNEITRPTLVVNKEVCLQNIARMAKKAADNKLRFRPHFKTHQSAVVGRWFKAFGVEAITVSSVCMAEYFAANGWNDITIAFPVNLLEIKNINQLATQNKLNILVENNEAAEMLTQKITNPLGVYIKIDTGYNRTGISSSSIRFINSIIKILSTNKKLLFKGFLTHTGHTYLAKKQTDVTNHHLDALEKLNSLKNSYKKDFRNIEISVGDTPSASICDNFEGVDEIRPGNFVFYDLMQYSLGACKIEDIATRMICPVVSKHRSRNEIIIYGGAVHFSKEAVRNADGKQIFGRIIIPKKGKKELLDSKNYLAKLSQEHGTLKVTPAHFKKIQVGDLVEILPIHSCLTANVMGYFQTTDGELIKMMPKY